MEAKLKTNGFHCYQRVFSQTLHREETQDSVVPDTLPDIREIINTSGTPLIRSKDISAGRVRLEANIPVRITCLPEEGDGLYCLDVNLPVYVSVEEDSISEGCCCVAELCLTVLETRVLNPRKVTVRAELDVCLSCYQQGEIALSAAPSGSEAAVHVLERSVSVTPVCAVTEKSFVLADELIMPPGKPSAAELLGQSVNLLVDDLKTVGTKLIMKGVAVSTLLYRAVDMAVDTAEFCTVFSQIIDTDCETEDAAVSTKLLLSGMYFDVAPGFDGRTLNMELHVVAQAVIRTSARLGYLADAYSNAFALELKREQRELCTVRRELTVRETLREQIEIPQPISEVLFCTAGQAGVSVEGDTAAIRLRVKLCCRSTEGQLLTADRTCTARLRAELGENESLLPGEVSIREPYAAPAGGGVELRLPVELRGFAQENQLLDCVCGISYDESESLDLSSQPTLVLMRVSSEDDLWKLARENCSTVEAIREANDLDSAGGVWERLLLIPKTV